MASLAGAWLALVAGLGVMRVQNGSLRFSPRLPDELERLAFRLLFQDRRISIEVTATAATYRLLDGPPLTVHHHGEKITLSLDEPCTQFIPPIQAGPRPSQPAGREPARRSVRV
jgi:alpha,alpha-trehalose phosphorylase